MTKVINIPFILSLLFITSCVLVGCLKKGTRNTGNVMVDEYDIVISSLKSREFDTYDTCQLIVSRKGVLSMSDTIFFYSKYGGSLTIMITPINKWSLVYNSWDYCCCTNNLINFELLPGKVVEAVVNESHMSLLELCYESLDDYRLDHCTFSGDMPYRLETIYSNSHKLQYYSKLRKTATARFGGLSADLFESYKENILLLTDNNRYTTDTLRWLKSSMGVTFPFLVSENTIVFRDDLELIRPSCSSPYIVLEQEVFQSIISKNIGLNSEQTDANDPQAVIIQVKESYGLLSKPIINMREITLSSSPFECEQVTEKFLKEKCFIYKTTFPNSKSRIQEN